MGHAECIWYVVPMATVPLLEFVMIHWIHLGKTLIWVALFRQGPEAVSRDLCSFADYRYYRSQFTVITCEPLLWLLRVKYTKWSNLPNPYSLCTFCIYCSFMPLSVRLSVISSQQEVFSFYSHKLIQVSMAALLMFTFVTRFWQNIKYNEIIRKLPEIKPDAHKLVQLQQNRFGFLSITPHPQMFSTSLAEKSSLFHSFKPPMSHISKFQFVFPT